MIGTPLAIPNWRPSIVSRELSAKPRQIQLHFGPSLTVAPSEDGTGVTIGGVDCMPCPSRRGCRVKQRGIVAHWRLGLHGLSSKSAQAT